MRHVLRALLVLAMTSVCASAQTDSQIFGKATDTSGAVLPGVTVTLTSPVLLQPRVAVTSEAGTYQFPGLAIGTYAVKFQLSGFGTFVNDGVQLQGSFNAQVNALLQLASLKEDIVVTGTSAIVDLRSTTQGARFNADELQALPTGRDVFSMLDKAPAILGASVNVGGSNLGQQNLIMSRGATAGQTRTFSDGADTGTGSNLPFYLDFDSFAEVQVNTGGADVTMQTSGAAINMVTKSGGDRYKGSTRYFVTDHALGSNNVTDELRRQGASSGNPVLNIKDYGVEVGGPLKRGRAWFWGGLSRQSLSQGAIGFYQKTPECLPIAANPNSFPVDDVTGCLQPKTNDLRHVNYKVGVQPFAKNQFTFRNSYDLKQELNRGADDTHPFAATTRLISVPSTLGAKFWTTGWPPLWRFADQHTFSDRWMLEVAYARFCPCTYIALADPALGTVQPQFEIATGLWDRSFNESINFTIKNNLDVTTNYFRPAMWGGDHSFKAGYKYLYFPMTSTAHVGGNAVARFNSGAGQPAFSVPFSAQLSRDSVRNQYLYQHSVYLQDTFTRGRMTVIAGFRWDRQDDRQGASTVPASPFQGQTTMNGTVFNFLPQIDFPGVGNMPVWSNFAPRVGATYDLFKDGRSVVKASFAQYYDQRSPGELSGTLNTIGSHTIDFPWQDLNNDKFVQANEINTSTILAFAGGFNPANPGLVTSQNQVDPNIKNARTDEVVASFSKELFTDLSLSASYIWRNYTNLAWAATGAESRRIGVSSADYTAVLFTPPASSCPAGARCEAVTYYVPKAPLPAPVIVTNRPDFGRTFNGVELVARKRLSRSWMLTGSYAYNSTVVSYDSPAAFIDPTNVEQRDGAQFAPNLTSGGLAATNPNAKWVARFSGTYRMPWHDIGLASTIDTRQGYPLLPAINIASRPNSAGTIDVLLDPIGKVRLPALRTVDFRVDKTFTIGRTKIAGNFDVFNLFNGNTVQLRRPVQNATNANQVSQILAPRIARLGINVTF